MTDDNINYYSNEFDSAETAEIRRLIREQTADGVPSVSTEKTSYRFPSGRIYSVEPIDSFNDSDSGTSPKYDSGALPAGYDSFRVIVRIDGKGAGSRADVAIRGNNDGTTTGNYNFEDESGSRTTGANELPINLYSVDNHIFEFRINNSKWAYLLSGGDDAGQTWVRGRRQAGDWTSIQIDVPYDALMTVSMYGEEIHS